MALTTCSSELPAAWRMASTFRRHWRVCSWIVSPAPRHWRPEWAVGAVARGLPVLVIVYKDQVVWIPCYLRKGAELLHNDAVGLHAS